MKLTRKNMNKLFFTVMLNSAFMSPAFAHMMLAQHGTLNVVDDGVFMVISLPVSAFEGIDDDLDGKVSVDEFNTHRLAIADQILNNVTLKGEVEKIPLKGLMMSLSRSHNFPDKPVSQLIAMGKFTFINNQSQLQFSVGLFGVNRGENNLEITVTRKADNQQSVILLTPTNVQAVLFAKTQ